MAIAGVISGPVPAAAITNSSISASAPVNFRDRSLSSGIMTGACLVRRLNRWYTRFSGRVSQRERHNCSGSSNSCYRLDGLFEIRPLTAIPFLFQGQQIQAWGGPFKGTVTMDGRNWIPYQPSTFPTPPFPECSSGHSTFSAAGAEILKLFTESDAFGDSATFLAGTSKIEPGHTPAQPVTLTWNTFTMPPIRRAFHGDTNR